MLKYRRKNAMYRMQEEIDDYVNEDINEQVEKEVKL